MLKKLQEELRSLSDPQRAKASLRFFKTGKGEYGEGDKFMGVNSPNQWKVVNKYWKEIEMSEIEKLVKSPIHEERMVGLLILTKKFKKATLYEQEKIYDFYLKHTAFINNWDLVDLTAYRIVGAFLEKKEKSILEKLAKSKSLWERRIAILSTFYYIGKGQSKESLKIAKILVADKHDLIHKAVGWMLREIGKRCGEEIEENFLKRYYKIMPRTMLRYAIERFPEEKRHKYLDGLI